MRAVLLAAAAAVVVVTPLAASAAPVVKDRTLTFDYTGTTGLDHPRAVVDLGCLPSVTLAGRHFRSCAGFTTQKGERTLALRAEDVGGRPGGFVVSIGRKAAGVFCGTATLTLPRAASTPVTVRPFSGECPATKGTFTATLSRR